MVSDTKTAFTSPLPSYDLTAMPPEDRVMALIDYWCHKDIGSALKRFAAFKLPPVAMQEMITEYGYAYYRHYSRPENRANHKIRQEWNIIAMILARGGSKGLPGKALRTVGGIPLIARTIHKCQSIQDVKRIIVNTDSSEIAALARRSGAGAPFLRPAELATDKALSSHAAMFGNLWLSMVERDYLDFLVVVSATHPLFDPEELNKALDVMAAEDATTMESVASLPTFNQEYYFMKGNTLTPLALPLLPQNQTTYAQCGAFSITGLGPYYHLYEPFLSKTQEYFPRPPAMAWPLPVEQCVDIDGPKDLLLADLLLSGSGERKNGKVDEDYISSIPKKLFLPELNKINSCKHVKLSFVRILWIPKESTPVMSESVPAYYRVLQILYSLGDGPLFIAGHGELVEAFSAQEKLPMIDTGILDCTDYKLYAAVNKKLERLGIQKSILIVNGRAVALRQESVIKFLKYATNKSHKPVCSVSYPPVHPAHLKWIGKNGLVSACDINAERRQDLPPVWCRDGVLTWLPFKEITSSFSCGIKLSAEEGAIIKTQFDVMRLQALSPDE